MRGFLEGTMNKITFLLILIFFMFSCGGGSNSTPTSTSTSTTTPAITGLQGDINAIEPVDLD